VSDETRESIRRIADDLGYVPSSNASGLRSGRTGELAVVTPSIGGWFYGSVLEGIDAELRGAGYDMVLFNLDGETGERKRLFHSSILRKRGDGVLALCVDFSAEERAELAALGLPAIIVGGPVRGFRFVGIDERDAAGRAVRHLLELGHRDILFVGGGAEQQHSANPSVPRERYHAYVAEMRAAGADEAHIRWLAGEFSTAVAQRRMSELLDRDAPRPTAVFAASDAMAIGVMLAAAEHGLRVPQDLSVVGIDDDPLAEPFQLTTVRQDPSKQGALAARHLLEELAGNTPLRRSLKLPVELVARATTAPPG
jgi:DNA-binding LacI/PurR family transcriptional regulator